MRPPNWNSINDSAQTKTICIRANNEAASHVCRKEQASSRTLSGPRLCERLLVAQDELVTEDIAAWCRVLFGFAAQALAMHFPFQGGSPCNDGSRNLLREVEVAPGALAADAMKIKHGLGVLDVGPELNATLTHKPLGVKVVRHDGQGFQGGKCFAQAGSLVRALVLFEAVLSTWALVPMLHVLLAGSSHTCWKTPVRCSENSTAKMDSLWKTATAI